MSLVICYNLKKAKGEMSLEKDDLYVVINKHYAFSGGLWFFR